MSRTLTFSRSLRVLAFKLWVSLFSFLCSALPSFAEPLKIDQAGTYPLLPGSLRITDAVGNLALADIQKLVAEQRYDIENEINPNFGYNSSAFWYYIELVSLQDQNWYLAIEYPLIDEIDIFIESGQELIHRRGGDLQPFSARDINSPQFYFKLKLPLEEKVKVYLRMRTQGTADFPVSVQDRATIDDHNHEAQIGHGIIMGSIIIMMAYFLVLALSSRALEHFYMSLFLFTFLMFRMIIQGVAFAYLFPELPLLVNKLMSVSIALLLMAGLVCNYAFIPVDRRQQSFHITFWILTIALGINALLCLFVSYRFNALSLIIGVACCAYVLIVSYLLFRRGYKPAKFFFLAWLATLSGGIFFCIQRIGIIPSNSWGLRVLEISVLAQIVLMAVGFSDKLNELRREANDRTQELKHSLQQLAKIVYPHQLQLIQSGYSLETTMPVGKGKGCVLAFDIIGSSRIEHEGLKTFLEASIKNCGAIMLDNYDPSMLIANAYRIKEMGDGFLCSVGFPFKAPQDESPAVLALELADRFVTSFQADVQKFAYDRPIHCCIGIAYGFLEAYFSSIGAKEYDIYGPAIVQATRYEQMRNALNWKNAGDLIILQEAVYNQLTPEQQERFTVLHLDQQSFRVRDDHGARFIAVWSSNRQAKAS